MNLSRLLVYIAVTAVSTYLIRVIPLVAIQKKIENRFFRSFLYYVPYAVLAAMIMPAVFYATGNLIASTIGFAIAMIFAYNKKNIVTVACASCIGAFIALVVLGLSLIHISEPTRRS